MTAIQPTEAGGAVAEFRARARWRWYEPLFWLGAIAWYFLFPTYLPLGTQILAAALFALSLDLILGYGGIVSLGHTTFFGIGAYTAGLLAKHGWGEPITCLIAGGAAAAIGGWICSFVIVRVQGVALLLVTLGINLVLYEAANKAYTITGGADGLQGIEFWKLLGVFDYDIYGRVAYIYTLVVVFLLFLVARRIVYSPFGLALKGMRENWKRMPALGAGLRRHGALIFVLSAAIAGFAGGLLAESVQFVALDSLGPQRSIDVLTMLIVGGTGVLYGSFVGATVYMVVRDQLADLNPAYWYFWIGLILVVVVLFTRNGIVGTLSDATEWLKRKRRGGAELMTATGGGAALATRGLNKNFGALKVTQDVAFSLPVGARHALIGPNGAGKTTFINLLTGMLTPDSGAIELDGQPITGLPPQARVKRGLARTYQINTLFPDLTPLEAVTLAMCERHGMSRQWFPPLAKRRAVIEEAYSLLAQLGIGDLAHRLTRHLAYGHQRVLEIALALATRPHVLLLDEPAAGVPAHESGILYEVISTLPRDIAVLFIEHDMDLVFRFATHITVLVSGRVLRAGPPQLIADDPEVRAVYLGTAAHG